MSHSLLLLIPLFSTMAAPGPNGRNMLANPSFEQGMDGWRFWKQFPQESRGAVDTTTGKFGRASFHVENPGHGGANLFSDNVPCEPGKSYTLSVYVRTKGKADAGVSAWAVGEDGEKTLTHAIAGSVRLPPDEFPKFTRFRHIFITPEGCRFIRAHLTCSAGEVWWDAVQIEPGGKPTAYEDADVLVARAKERQKGPRNLLPNSSFGEGLSEWRLWQQVAQESSGAVERVEGAVRQQAFHVVNRGTKGANFFSDRPVPCAPGQSYTLSAWVKTLNAQRVKLTGWALDANGKTLTYGIGPGVAVPSTTGKFVRVSTTFVAPAEARALRAHLICNGGEVWWAAVQLEAAKEVTDYVDGPTTRQTWAEAALYANAVVREARARDLMQQVERLLKYCPANAAAQSAADAGRRALAAAAERIQVDLQVPDYEHVDYPALDRELASTEAALTQAFQLLTNGRTPSHDPWRPKLKTHVTKDELLREFIVFPIAAWPILNGRVSWKAIEPLGFRAISHFAYAPVRPDGTADLDQLHNTIQTNAEAGYHTVLAIEPPGSLAKLLEDEVGEQAFFHNSKGEWSRRSHCHNLLNIWNDRVRDRFCDYLRAIGQRFRDEPRLLAYELVNEPSMQMARHKEGGDAYDWEGLGYGGYSKPARAAWTAWLRTKYTTIESLNAKWGTAHPAFEDVKPPDDLAPPAPVDSRTRHAVAAHNDFCRFRADAHTRFFAALLNACHEADPVHAVMSQFCGLGPDRKEAGLDYLDIDCNAPWDIYGTHDWPGHRPAVASLYACSMNRYAKRPHWEDEFIWSQWERKGTPERVMRAANERNLWRQIAYGKRGIILFNLSNEWAHTKPNNWNNSILNIEADYQVPRYSSGIFPVIERKVNAFKEAVIDTELTNQGIAILRPTTSSYAAAPNHTTRREASALAGWLLARHWMPLFVPEECILDGREDMTHVRVLIAPYATHVAAGLETALLDWVAAGGTLICSGPFGLFDQYGAPQGKLIKKVFGVDRLQFQSDRGRWEMAESESDVLDARHGRGRVWLSLDCVGIAGRPAALAAPVREAMPVHPITCDVAERLELILRNTAQGDHYLFATNLDPRNAVDTTVLLPGCSGPVTDLCVDGGAPVPVRQDALSMRVPLHLGPGKGVVFKLGKRAKLTSDQERRLRDMLAAERETRYQALLARASRPAPSPLMAARQKMALAFARMAKDAGDFKLAEHYLSLAHAPAKDSAGVSVPRLKARPGIDGDLSEWQGAKWHTIAPSRRVVGNADSAPDLSARFALGRSGDRLYLAVQVRDDSVRNAQPKDTLWQEDCLEVFLDFMHDADASDGRYGFDDFQFFLATSGLQRVQTKQSGAAADFKVKPTKDGYHVEAAFDLSQLGVAVAKGMSIGFDLSIDDADAGAKRECQIAWRGTASNWRDSRKWGCLVLE